MLGYAMNNCLEPVSRGSPLPSKTPATWAQAAMMDAGIA
jgi:hypothetical protein